MWQPLIMILIMIGLLYGWRTVYRGGYLLKAADSSGNRQLFIYFILIWILSVFGVTAPDYWSYLKMNLGFYPDRMGNTFESFYLLLVRTIPDYTLWRSFIWGVSAILLLLAIKRSDVSVTSALLFTTVLYITSFYAFRNVLGFSILYYALTLWCNPGDIYIARNRIIAVMLALISLLCHNTMIITLLIVIISAMSVSRKKLFAILAITAVCFVLVFLSVTWLQAFTGDNVPGGMIGLRVQQYVLGGSEPLSFYAIFMRLLMTSPIWAALTVATYELYFRNKTDVTHSIVLSPSGLIKWCYNIALISSCVAFVFLVPGLSQWIYLRVQLMGVFPLILVLAWIYKGERTRLQKILLLYLLAFYAWSLWRMAKNILILPDIF